MRHDADLRREATAVIAKPASVLFFDTAVWYLVWVCGHMYLDDLRSLSQKKVSNLELRKIRIALTVLSSIPELDCFTALES